MNSQFVSTKGNSIAVGRYVLIIPSQFAQWIAGGSENLVLKRSFTMDRAVETSYPIEAGQRILDRALSDVQIDGTPCLEVRYVSDATVRSTDFKQPYLELYYEVVECL